MKEKLIYICDHCKREYKIKANAKRHELNCWKSKDNCTCLTCKFNGGTEQTDGDDFEMSEPYIICNHKECEGAFDKIPVIDCPLWEEDLRTKKEKQKAFIESIKGDGADLW